MHYVSQSEHELAVRLALGAIFVNPELSAESDADIAWHVSCNVSLVAAARRLAQSLGLPRQGGDNLTIVEGPLVYPPTRDGLCERLYAVSRRFDERSSMCTVAHSELQQLRELRGGLRTQAACAAFAHRLRVLEAMLEPATMASESAGTQGT